MKEPDSVARIRAETALMLGIIASCIADGTFKQFIFTASENQRSTSTIGGPRKISSTIGVRFSIEVDSELFAAEVRKRRQAVAEAVGVPADRLAIELLKEKEPL